jgi:hypothetical protein
MIFWRWQWQPKTARQQLIAGGAFMVFISSGFVLATGPFAYRERRLAREGQPATATVVKKVLHSASDSRNSDTSTSYEVDYIFTAADGRRVKGSDTIDPDQWDQLNEGGPVEVEYAASAPRINQIAGGGGYLVSAIFAGVFSLLWLVGAALVLKGWLNPPSPSPKPSGQEGKSHSQPAIADNAAPSHSNALLSRITSSPWSLASLFPLVCGPLLLLIGGFAIHQAHLYRAEGKLATGIVLTKSSHEEQQHDYNSNVDTRVVHYELGYRFNTETGQSIRGSEEVSWRTWSSINERDPIQILYLPHHPAANRLAGHSSVLADWLVVIVGVLLSGVGMASLCYGVLLDAPRKAAGLEPPRTRRLVPRKALPRRPK